jgi:hypothetical protein
MNSYIQPSATSSVATLATSLTDINGLRLSGIFPQGREPSIRTLRSWTRGRRIPHHRLGHFVYYDIGEVSAHIRVKLMVPPRN